MSLGRLKMPTFSSLYLDGLFRPILKTCALWVPILLARVPILTNLGPKKQWLKKGEWLAARFCWFIIVDHDPSIGNISDSMDSKLSDWRYQLLLHRWISTIGWICGNHSFGKFLWGEREYSSGLGKRLEVPRGELGLSSPAGCLVKEDVHGNGRRRKWENRTHVWWSVN